MEFNQQKLTFSACTRTHKTTRRYGTFLVVRLIVKKVKPKSTQIIFTFLIHSLESRGS